MLGLLFIWGSCREDLDYAPSAGNLEFSRDTVFLDTVFSRIGSSTYTLKVYNRTLDDIEIPSIKLGLGEESDYRLNVDGQAGNEFVNIPLFAKDSLYIFIETTHELATSEQNEFLYTDVIQFDSGQNRQEVQLVTLIKDAIFLFPRTLQNGTKEKISLGLNQDGTEILVNGLYLPENHLNFTADKPYVVYGYAAVPENKELQIDAGARIHFHKDSGLFISKNASLKVNGTLSTDLKLMENEVIFEGDRLEPPFEYIAGQWGSVILSKGSINNELNHLTIKNATVGLMVEGDVQFQPPTLLIKNSKIYNSSSTNLWSKSAKIIGENCVFGSAGHSSLFINMGGEYSFVHTTIANFWQNGFRTGTALKIDNLNNVTPRDLVKADFINCIIEGNTDRELSLNADQNSLFNFYFSHCLLKYKIGSGNSALNPLYDFTDPDNYSALFVNGNADFENPHKNNFKIGQLSTAASKAEKNTSLTVPLDILGMDRTMNPAIGAFQISSDN